MLQVGRLEGFYWVAKTGGYAKAARAFPYPITQPGVHAQVRRLEEELGVRLFARVAKDEMVPTREGRALLAFCAPFFDGLPGVERQLRSREVGGELRIDAGALEMQTVVPALAKRLRTARPDVRVRLREIDAPDYDRLRRGDTDLVIEHQPELPAGIAGVDIGAYQAFLAVPDTHPIARRAKTARPRDLAGAPFIAFEPGSRANAMQMSGLASADVTVDVVATASTVATILALVGVGVGLSLIVWPAPNVPQFAGVKLARVPTGRATLPITAAFRATATPDPLVEAVLVAAAERDVTRGPRRRRSSGSRG